MMERLNPDLEEPSDLYWSLWWFISPRRVYNILRFLWVLVNNCYVIPAYFAWLLLFSPLLLINSSAFWKIEDVLFGWLLNMVACWNYTAGYYVVESGDRLEKNTTENVLFMPNHQSTADVPLCMTLFTAREHFADRVMWIMDRVFKYSNFGCVSWMHDDFFILAGKEHRDSSLVELRNHLHNVFVRKRRKYIVVFPEGGFLRKRKPVSHRFAKKNDLPMLEYCTLPRTGALEVIFDVLGPTKVAKKVDNNGFHLNNGCGEPKGITKICDVTIAYPDGGNPLDLFQIVFGSRASCITHVHYRIFDVKDIPQDPEAMRQWMYNLYAEKEKMLEEYYKTGIFPYNMFPPATTSTATSPAASERQPRPLYHDPIKFVLLHLFFGVSTSLMYFSCRQLLW